MEILLYNACLVITKNNNKNFGIVGLQMDNILIIRTEVFMRTKKTKIIKAKFKAKIQTILKTDAS